MDYREGYNYYDKKEKDSECKKEEKHECKKEDKYEEYIDRKEEIHIPCNDGGKVCFPPCTICGNEDIETTINESARVLNVKVKLKKVCGNKKVCIGVLVFEKGKLVRVRATEMKVCGRNQCTCPPPIDFWFIFEDRDLCDSRKFDIKVVADYCEC
ncbi:MAG: hypothetical protein AB6733_03375 [Clostridiaceae bacterium]